MLLISTVILIPLAQQCFGQALTDQDGPHKFSSELHANQWHHNYLQNLTENFCKDATLKLYMAQTIQNSYAGTSGYELGSIAANILGLYRHMLKVYRYYSNHLGFKDEKHNLSQIMAGYSVMHGDYNEILGQTILFYDILDEHAMKEKNEAEEAKTLSVQYGMSVSAVRDMQKKGINLKDFSSLSRRAMQEEQKPESGIKQLQPKKYSRRQFLMEGSSNINTWTPKKKNNTKEEEYKRKLRYKMWAEKWNGFNGETEGVKIADTIAKLGLTNDSTFLLKELQGTV